MAKHRMKRIPLPKGATPPRMSTDIAPERSAEIQSHRAELLDEVHRAVEAYVNNPQLTFDAPPTAKELDDDDYDEDGSGFPSWRRLNGTYYLGNEDYQLDRKASRIAISVMCRCRARATEDLPEDDYLGLNVHLHCPLAGPVSFAVAPTNSSSI